MLILIKKIKIKKMILCIAIIKTIITNRAIKFSLNIHSISFLMIQLKPLNIHSISFLMIQSRLS
jgi:hypothetical protein